PIAGVKERRWLHSTIEQFGLVLGAEDDLPNVLERNARICRKANRGFSGNCPALSEVVAGAQQRAPITLRRSPNAVLCGALVIGHGIDCMAVKIGATHIPSPALRVGSQNECSFGRTDKQKKVSFLNLRVPHAV